MEPHLLNLIDIMLFFTISCIFLVCFVTLTELKYCAAPLVLTKNGDRIFLAVKMNGVDAHGWCCAMSRRPFSLTETVRQTFIG